MESGSLNFLGTDEYHVHKIERFPKIDFDIPVSKNEAFLLHSEVLRNERYICFINKCQPYFEDLLARIEDDIKML